MGRGSGPGKGGTATIFLSNMAYKQKLCPESDAQSHTPHRFRALPHSAFPQASRRSAEASRELGEDAGRGSARLTAALPCEAPSPSDRLLPREGLLGPPLPARPLSPPLSQRWESVPLPWPQSGRRHLTSRLSILKCLVFSQKGAAPSSGRPSARGKVPSALRKWSTVSQLTALGKRSSESRPKSSDFLECLFFFFFFFLCLWRSASECATERSESC